MRTEDRFREQLKFPWRLQGRLEEKEAGSEV